MNEVHFEHRSDWRSMTTKWGDRVARRGDILRAGRSLLRENGLGGLQMRDVAKRAGVGLGTVYTYFPTKEALFAVLYAQRLDRLLAEVEPMLSSTTDIEEVFVAIATSYRDSYTEFGKDLDVFAIVGKHSRVDATTRDQLVASTRRLLSQTRALLERAGVANPDVALTFLWSSMTGLADHFTSTRHRLLHNNWDEAVRYAALALSRGLVYEERPATGGRPTEVSHG
jgi:AcrR family transcriptional regulator